MTARRLLRAAKRTARRLLRPLRLRLIKRLIDSSEREIERLREMRDDLVLLERHQNNRQVQLCVRRIEIEQG